MGITKKKQREWLFLKLKKQKQLKLFKRATLKYSQEIKEKEGRIGSKSYKKIFLRIQDD